MASDPPPAPGYSINRTRWGQAVQADNKGDLIQPSNPTKTEPHAIVFPAAYACGAKGHWLCGSEPYLGHRIDNSHHQHTSLSTVSEPCLGQEGWTGGGGGGQQPVHQATNWQTCACRREK